MQEGVISKSKSISISLCSIQLCFCANKIESEAHAETGIMERKNHCCLRLIS